MSNNKARSEDGNMIIDSGKNHQWMLNESHCVKCVGGQDISIALKYFTTDNVLITEGRRVTLEWRKRADTTFIK